MRQKFTTRMVNIKFSTMSFVSQTVKRIHRNGPNTKKQLVCITNIYIYFNLLISV
jgi:hypothetical protein